MKKRVYIVLSHHHALREWFRYHECKPDLLSFDYHTDFHKAFIRKAGNPGACHTYSRERHNLYLKKHIPCEDIDAAINDLENDEQIDFAIRSGIIQKAFVFSHMEYGDRRRVLTVPPIVMSTEQIRIAELMHQFAPRLIAASTHSDVDTQCDIIGETLVEEGIVSYPEHRHPLIIAKDESQMAKLVTDDTILDVVLETFCKNGFNQDNYILDFDCDFIRDTEAMTHGHFNLLKELIKGAKAITIAQEPSCVSDCSRQALSYKEIEDWLIKLIRGCVNDVQIEFDGKAISFGRKDAKPRKINE